MPSFRIWGRVEHIGPRDFFVISSAMPVLVAERPIVLTVMAESVSRGPAEKQRLMLQVAEQARSRGGVIVERGRMTFPEAIR